MFNPVLIFRLKRVGIFCITRWKPSLHNKSFKYAWCTYRIQVVRNLRGKKMLKTGNTWFITEKRAKLMIFRSYCIKNYINQIARANAVSTFFSRTLINSNYVKYRTSPWVKVTSIALKDLCLPPCDNRVHDLKSGHLFRY